MERSPKKQPIRTVQGSAYGPLFIHNMINELQAAHSLRGETEGDFERYRQWALGSQHMLKSRYVLVRHSRYCSRRLRRLRRKLGSSHAKGKLRVGFDKVQNPTAEHVLILALLAERAWGHAMELKARASLDVVSRVHGSLSKTGKTLRISTPYRRMKLYPSAFGTLGYSYSNRRYRGNQDIFGKF